MVAVAMVAVTVAVAREAATEAAVREEAEILAAGKAAGKGVEAKEAGLAVVVEATAGTAGTEAEREVVEAAGRAVVAAAVATYPLAAQCS